MPSPETPSSTETEKPYRQVLDEISNFSDQLYDLLALLTPYGKNTEDMNQKEIKIGEYTFVLGNPTNDLARSLLIKKNKSENIIHIWFNKKGSIKFYFNGEEEGEYNREFNYPDDDGKEITISESHSGNLEIPLEKLIKFHDLLDQFYRNSKKKDEENAREKNEIRGKSIADF